MKGREKTHAMIDDVPVTYEGHLAPPLIVKAGHAIAEQMRDVPLESVRVTSVWQGKPWIEYNLRGRPLTITIGEGHHTGQLLEVLEEARTQIASYEAALSGPARIDRIDARIALLNAGTAMLRRMAAPHSTRLRLNKPQKDARVRITRPSLEMKFDGGRLQRTADRIEATLWGTEQSWDNRSLVVATSERYPQLVINAMAGRNIDEIVSGGLLAGTGAIIRKAWTNGQRLGFSFASETITVDEAIAQHRILHPHAA